MANYSSIKLGSVLVSATFTSQHQSEPVRSVNLLVSGPRQAMASGVTADSIKDRDHKHRPPSHSTVNKPRLHTLGQTNPIDKHARMGSSGGRMPTYATGPGVLAILVTQPFTFRDVPRQLYRKAGMVRERCLFMGGGGICLGKTATVRSIICWQPPVD